jgi:hypothetical protein
MEPKEETLRDLAKTDPEIGEYFSDVGQDQEIP